MKLSGKACAAGGQAGQLNCRGTCGAIVSLLAATLANPALRAETVVTTGVSSGQVVQKTDPFRVITSGTVEVQAGGTAVFRSGNFVSLQPGFKALTGSSFRATIAQSPAIPLAWTAVSGSIRYDVYRDGVKIGETTGTSYLDATAAANAAYTYVIKAIASGGAETTVPTSSFQLFTPLLAP